MKTAAARYLLRGRALQARTQCACYASKPVTKCIASEELSPHAWSASVLGGRFVYDCKKPSDMLIALSVGPSSRGPLCSNTSSLG